MEAVKVGVREFREQFASYLESETPIAITRHGETLGYYIPARQQRTEQEKKALKEAWSRLQKVMKAKGITEDEILADFQQRRKAGKK